MDKRCTLAEAIERHVRPGDALHLGATHVRGSASAWEILKQFDGRDPAFEIQAVSMTTAIAPLVHRGLVRRVVTSWSGDVYYSPGPNPVYTEAHERGVEWQHWSILSLPQRLWAAARGMEWTTSRSLAGSTMAEENGQDYRPLEDGLGLIRALTPDLSLFHAPAADAEGNVLFTPPMFENVWGALAARRGAVVTVEKIVDADYVRRHAHMMRLPSSAVVAVAEVPFGAHPGGIYAPALPGMVSYGEDHEFWANLRATCRDPQALDAWIEEWILKPAGRAEYLEHLGRDRIDALIDQADPARVPAHVRAALERVDLDAEPTPIERTIVAGSRLLARRVEDGGLSHMLAGAGMANLAAWLAAAECEQRGVSVDLAAEMGLVGYHPQDGEPFIFNHRNFPTCTMLADIDTVMAVLMGGARARSIASLGAAQIDRRANINTTRLGGRLLMGSGGANDVATNATECVITVTQSRDRFPEGLEYVTSPGDRVVAVASTLGVYGKDDGELILTGVYDRDVEAAVRAAREQCGWDLRVARTVEVLPPPERREIRALRLMDPAGWFRQP